MSSAFHSDWKWRGDTSQKASGKADSGLCEACVSESPEGLLKMQTSGLIQATESEVLGASGQASAFQPVTERFACTLNLSSQS